jgi:hypothetical protein
MTAIALLRIGGPVEPWTALGLHVVDDQAVIAGVLLRFEGGPPGLHGWGLADTPVDIPLIDIDGIPTDAQARPTQLVDSHLPIVGFDHVVINTSSLERTCGAIEAATGEPLKRIRDVGSIRQGFHRFHDIVIEVVESPQVVVPEASLWGFVWNVADLNELCGQWGPGVVSAPKPAVQPGRFIATVRAHVGLGLPVALMSTPQGVN